MRRTTVDEAGGESRRSGITELFNTWFKLLTVSAMLGDLDSAQ